MTVGPVLPCQGSNSVGGLVGVNDFGGTIGRGQATGDVTGTDPSTSEQIGGLVGGNAAEATIISSSATGTVSGHQKIGGLAGVNNGTVRDSHHETGTVSGNNLIGGLVGSNIEEGDIRDNSYASSAVSGQQQVGGLVGRNEGGAVNDSHASGAGLRPAMGRWAGGVNVVARLLNDPPIIPTISASHATGTVTGADLTTRQRHWWAGGYNGGIIEDSYHKTGTVSGAARIGGLVGYSYQGTIRTTAMPAAPFRASNRSAGWWDGTKMAPSATVMPAGRFRASNGSVGWWGRTQPGPPLAPAMPRALSPARIRPRAATLVGWWGITTASSAPAMLGATYWD